MPLIKCSECSRDVSEKAESCPGCGNPIARKAAAQAWSPRAGGDELKLAPCAGEDARSRPGGES